MLSNNRKRCHDLKIAHVFFVTFPCGVLGQVWCLIVSIPDVCLLSYFFIHASNKDNFKSLDEVE